jgi:hypothetical protein
MEGKREMTRFAFVNASAIAIVAGMSLVAAAPAARAEHGSSQSDNDQPATLGPRSESLPALSAQWWQLVFSVPPADNPLLDTTGANCMVGNRGPVWFLFGNLFGGTNTRACTLPQGKTLFIPIFTQFELNTPDICGQVGPLTVAQERSLAAMAVNSASDVHITLDGVAIDKKIVRAKSPVFDATFPADNIFNAPCGPPGVPAGVYSPGVVDGLYVLLRPLGVGTHMLHFQAKASVPVPFSADVTYTLNIAPVVLK